MNISFPMQKNILLYHRTHRKTRLDLTPDIFTISGASSACGCQQLVSFVEVQGFDAATINAWPTLAQGGAKQRSRHHG